MRIIQTDPDEGKHMVEISTEEARLLQWYIKHAIDYGTTDDDLHDHILDKLNRIIP